LQKLQNSIDRLALVMVTKK